MCCVVKKGEQWFTVDSPQCWLEAHSAWVYAAWAASRAGCRPRQLPVNATFPAGEQSEPESAMTLFAIVNDCSTVLPETRKINCSPMVGSLFPQLQGLND
jgi:hypothetical protein